MIVHAPRQVWPGSHARVWPRFARSLSFDPDSQMREEVTALCAEAPPVRHPRPRHGPILIIIPPRLPNKLSVEKMAILLLLLLVSVARAAAVRRDP